MHNFPQDNLQSIDLNQLKLNNNWQSQFRLLTQWGELIKTKTELRTQNNRVIGCETAAWLAHQQNEEMHYFYFDGDSKIIRGLTAVVLSMVNGKTTQQITEQNLEQLLQNLGIRKHLTPSRSNGFRAILSRVYAFSGADKI